MTLPFAVPDKDDPQWTRRGALYVRRSEGVTRSAAGDTYTIKITGAQTGGSLGLVEASVPPGGGPIAHAHTYEDEAFYLLSGELELLNGDEIFTAEAGDFVFVPRGTRHRFKNVGMHYVHMLFLFTPSGPEKFFLEDGGSGEARPGETPAQWESDDYGRMHAQMEKYGTVLLPEES